MGELSRYHVLEWLNFIATDLHKGCSPFFNPNIPDEVKEEIFKPNLKKSLKFLAQNLDKKPYLNDTFSIADCYLFVILSWLPRIGLDLSEWPSVEQYVEKLKSRKAFQQSLQEEGLTNSTTDGGAACSIK